MAIWKISPAAHRGDGRWQDSDIWDEVLVTAPSAAEARLAAATLDIPDVPEATQPNDPFVRSRFADEKLYHVERVEPDAAPEDVAGRDDGNAAGGARVLVAEKPKA